MRVGIDTGGTFTDAVGDDGRVVKLPSSRQDPASVIAAALRGLAPTGAVDLVHGTTVATNALLERKLARVGLLTNAGFRDLLAIGRQNRPALYALEPRKPWLPVPEGFSTEVKGRLAAGGVEIEPFDADACRRAGRALVAKGAEALAVVFLHSYANPDHEHRALRALEGLGVPVTASSALNPEFREVERGVTAVVDAGLKPVAGAYLARLRQALTGGTRVHVLTSEGGLATPEEAATEPARLLVSGPAGGLVGAQAVAQAVAAPRVLTLDMGGTSTDVAWIDGELPRRQDLRVAGLEIRVPSLEIHTVGAGGGSLVGRDPGGALTVGPESAGSDPGPAAYGRSDGVTVTDANLLLGRLSPRFFAAGEEALDLVHAERAARRAASRFGLPLRSFLEGIVRLSDLAMARALRVISLEKGRDPRAASLLVFGGAGGLHGSALARELGIAQVIVPHEAGVLAARGLLFAPPARTQSRSVLCDQVPARGLRRRFALPLVETLRDRFRREGFRRASLRATIGLDLRYRGQSFELEIPDGADPVAEFHRRHEARFGFADRQRTVELIAVRVRVVAEAPAVRLPRLRARSRAAPEPVERLRPVFERGARIPVFDRERLAPAAEIHGPAVVADRTGTTFVAAGDRATVHSSGALLVQVAPRSAGGHP